MENTEEINKLETGIETSKKESYYLEEKFGEYLIIQGLSNRTRISIKRGVLVFYKWVESQQIELVHVSYTDVLAYVNYCKSKGNKQRTIQVIIVLLTHYYTFLVEEKEVLENPCSNVDVKGVKRRILYETFSPEELAKMCKQFSERKISNGFGGRVSIKRDIIILGLIVYQGIRTEELARLTVTDIKIQEGKIHIVGSKRTNERILPLESHQIYDLMDYINDTRKIIVALRGQNTNALFLSLGRSETITNIMDRLLRQLKAQQKKKLSVKQLRASVITNWLKAYNLRKVQYMAGHRYVSSTEAYQANNMDELQEDVNRYHPDF